MQQESVTSEASQALGAGIRRGLGRGPEQGPRDHVASR